MAARHLGSAHIVARERSTPSKLQPRSKDATQAALKKELVDDENEWKRLRGVITERWLRQPKASFVYAVDR